MKNLTRVTGLLVALAVLAPAALRARPGLQSTGETFTATASVKGPSGSGSKPLTIHIDHLASDADRTKLLAVVKTNDAAAIIQALAAMADIGYISVGDVRTPVKYAYAHPTGGGRLLTVVTAKPVAFVGANAPGAKPKAGHELALALLVLDENNKGDGEISPAARVQVDAAGAIVTSDYSHEIVRLTGITKIK